MSEEIQKIGDVTELPTTPEVLDAWASFWAKRPKRNIVVVNGHWLGSCDPLCFDCEELMLSL